jgi:hypothetical protein
MAFIVDNNTVISFAEYDDVFKTDERLFETNESLTDDKVEELLIRATERILTRLRSSAWWRSYYLNRISGTTNIKTVADIPALDTNRIVARQKDFTDLCVYIALSDYIYPALADFGNEADPERAKMGYYANRSEVLFGELITVGDWYDFNDDGTIESNEKAPGQYNLKRVR